MLVFTKSTIEISYFCNKIADYSLAALDSIFIYT